MQNDALDCGELAEQRLNAERFKHELARVAGGLLDADTVRTMLGLSTKESVYEAAAEGRILAVEGDGQLRFPLCQFGDGCVLPGIEAILEAAPNTNGWRVLQYLYGQEEGLAGDRPIDLIRKRSPDLEHVVRFARRLEQ